MPPTPPKKPERMSSVDTAWLRMDRPTNLMMICGVLIFGERLTLARLKATLSDRFLRFERFRQHPVQSRCGNFISSMGTRAEVPSSCAFITATRTGSR